MSWTFVTNHGAVLSLIGSHGQITARQISARLGITERSVRRIIRDLEHEGYLTTSKHGRLNRYSVNAQLPLRRSDQRGVVVAELLGILKGDLEETDEP